MVRQGDTINIRKRDKNVVQVQEQVPHTVEPAVKDHFDDSGNYMQLESRETAIGEILRWLQSDEIPDVALYGMVGAGKTTLAKQVGKRAKEMHIFDLVVFVSVTYYPNVKKIQGDIADQLGLRLGEEADAAARQRQISLRLINEEGRVLIILDNVWQRIDLQRIGILNDGSRHMGCKLLLTTRNRQVGQVMGFKCLYDIYLLSDEEAWQLLKKRAGIYDGSPDLIYLAKEVAECCGGLPLAISLVGSSLRGQTVDRWGELVRKFRLNPHRAIVDRLMQLCYDAISSEAAKTVLLIGALFPTGHEILIEDLSHYAIRLGPCSSKNEVSAAIITLMDSCFLMHSDKSKDHVIMHDLVHDMVVSMIGSKNPTYRDHIEEYIDALYQEEDFQWREELDTLLCRLYGVREQYPSSSSTSNSLTIYGGGGGDGRKLQVVPFYSYTIAAVTLIPKPSGRQVDFKGLCQVDKSFQHLLKKTDKKWPQVINSMREHPEKEKAFECLGWVLFLLSKVKDRDWADVNLRHVLDVSWVHLKTFEFELGWLSPSVEGLLSSDKIAGIESLKKEERLWSEEVARLREQLKTAERNLADARAKITRVESELGGFPIAQVLSVTPTPFWKKLSQKR